MPGIDHVVLCVRDLDRAAAFYEGLGFTLTPRAQHPFGTGNRLAQLDGCFLELLAVTKPEDVPEAAAGEFSFGAYNRDFLSRAGEGFSMLALKTSSWQDDRQRFREAGFAEYAPFGFGRTARQPDGTEVKLDFRLTFAADPAMPDAVFFTCDHRHPPRVFWKPEYQTHANGAVSITDVYMAGADPAAHRGYLEKLFGPAMDAQGGLTFAMASAALHVMTPAAADALSPSGCAVGARAARFVGFRVAVKGALPAAVAAKDGFGAFVLFNAA
ncbi:MAG: VOC family protein [Rhodospirillaceae bacterium]